MGTNGRLGRAAGLGPYSDDGGVPEAGVPTQLRGAASGADEGHEVTGAPSVSNGTESTVERVSFTPSANSSTIDRNGPADPGDNTDPPASTGSSGVSSDARVVLSYLLLGEVEDYIAIMDVLEGSVTDLSPAEVSRALSNAQTSLPSEIVEDRLDRLRQWGAAHATTDTSRIKRHSDLLARNWRYTATAAGRQVHRFYRTVLAGTSAVREIPLASLNRVLRTLEALTDGTALDIPDAISSVFVSHDDLDSALVGTEDSLAGLADRYDLGSESTAQLRSLLVDYATRVAAELENGSARVAHQLAFLADRFEELAATAVAASEAKTLIERGTLIAAKGGRVEDWEGLSAWFDPSTGRAAKFSMRLVRALPGMHSNLRRLHTSSGAATSRARALQLAAACADPDMARTITLAALGDHAWRKLWGASDDDELLRTPSWAAGPQVPMPELLGRTGRGGARGRAGAARDDSAAREAVAARRAERLRLHTQAVTEVLAARPGTELSQLAARVAMQSLMSTVRSPAADGLRCAVTDGLACTVLRVTAVGERPAIRTECYTVWTPGRVVFFHPPGTSADSSEILGTAVVPDTDGQVELDIVRARPPMAAVSGDVA